MKKLLIFVLLGGFVLPSASLAIDLKQAKFTQVVNSVDVITPSDQARHAAEVNDIFKMPDVLRTGPASRAELVATDNTITRVGANTVFSFDPTSRTIDLQQGSLLFHSPHGKGGGTIHTGSATASVLGTTIIVTTTPNGGFKVLVLEGEAEIRFLNGLHLKLTPGQMTFVLPGGGTSPIVVFRLDD
jgi:ferric-dicitrate binding protein FerR (iron transport regulator)